ncbi:flagellar hook protein [Aliishimia ponticola]|uniref:Flagellar hook protein n=1 Tax=Aliishimia ponticola TaxID=2499833 RepID=A0A4S4N8C5_9RHOB|nr:flagellin [Aliishimia ponticola]THH34805.1 flagellar hook protein [Aliishimia ponticola]
MPVNSYGDLARAYALRNQSTLLKTEIEKLNLELSSGQTADIADHLGGSYSRLTSIERDMRVLEGFDVSISEAEQYADLAQAQLEQISDVSATFARSVIAGDSSNSVSSTEALANEARVQFSTVVSLLNSEAAGRSLFAGDMTDQNPLVSASDILTEIEAVVAGATSATDVETALDTWFADPLGFDAFAYTGSDTALAPFQMSESAEVSVDIRANDDVFKNTLKSLAMAAMATSSGVTLSGTDKSALFRASGENLLTAETNIVSRQASVGLLQEQVAGWKVRNQTEMSGLEYAKSALLSIDPYEAATELEAAQFQLESLYTVTVRLSQLSLVNFLR